MKFAMGGYQKEGSNTEVAEITEKVVYKKIAKVAKPSIPALGCSATEECSEWSMPLCSLCPLR